MINLGYISQNYKPYYKKLMVDTRTDLDELEMGRKIKFKKDSNVRTFNKNMPPSAPGANALNVPPANKKNLFYTSRQLNMMRRGFLNTANNGPHPKPPTKAEWEQNQLDKQLKSQVVMKNGGKHRSTRKQKTRKSRK